MVRQIPKYFAETHYARGMKISGYGGFDGFLLGNLAEEMGFTVRTIAPGENSSIEIMVQGNYNNSIDDVLSGRADIAFNSRFLLNYGANDAEYMVPILGNFQAFNFKFRPYIKRFCHFFLMITLWLPLKNTLIFR